MATLTPSELQAWIAVGAVLTQAGLAVAGTLKAIFTAGGLTPEQQDQVIAGLQDDNVRRRAISAAIAFGDAGAPN